MFLRVLYHRILILEAEYHGILDQTFGETVGIEDGEQTGEVHGTGLCSRLLFCEWCFRFSECYLSLSSASKPELIEASESTQYVMSKQPTWWYKTEHMWLEFPHW